MTKLFSTFGGFLLKLFGGGLGPQLLQALNQAYRDKMNAKTETARITADVAIEFLQGQISILTSANAEGTKRQGIKMNHKVFWFILLAALLPGLSTFFLIAIYNVFWHAKGIWPQPWNIAAFPEPYDAFSQMAMEWLFDPVKVASSTGTAVIGGYLTGSRK